MSLPLRRITKTSQPLISVIVPTLNEEGRIQECLESILQQDIQEPVEIIVIDGGSTDGTVQIVKELQGENDSLVLLDNPHHYTPHALNIALERAQGNFVARVDAHSYVPLDYLRKCLNTFRRIKKKFPKLAGVGGRWKCANQTALGKAVFYATTSWFGGGISKYRYSRKSQFVETIVYGFYDKEVLEEQGFADEAFIKAQDAELNLRLREASYCLYYDSEIFSYYYAPDSLKKLARQQFVYGKARRQLIQKHPRSNRVVFLIPTGFAIYLIALPLLLVLFRLRLLLLPSVIYSLSSVCFSLQIGLREKLGKSAVMLPVIFLTTHFNYGLGFVAQAVTPVVRQLYSKR